MRCLLAAVEGPVRGDPVGGQQGAVEDDVRLRRRGADRLGQGGREGDEQLDRLDDVPVGGGGADAEPGRKLGVGVPALQVREGEQGLTSWGQTPPSGPALVAPCAQLGGQQTQGRGGHVDAGRVDKHMKPLVETVLLAENPSTRGFAVLSGQRANSPRRLEEAHYLPFRLCHVRAIAWESLRAIRRIAEPVRDAVTRP